MENIKNIIFDLGNVILNIDTKKSEIEFEKHGLTNFENLYNLASQTELFDKLEIGAIEPKDFCVQFRNITSKNLSDEIIKSCWNALILDYPPKRIEYLKKLKPIYRTFILSNTNIIHYHFYTEILNNLFKLDGLEELVEKAYFSHENKMKKPDLNYYNFVLNDAGIIANETLFIDDNKANVEAAASLGINTIWLQNNNLVEVLEDLFPQLKK